MSRNVFEQANRLWNREGRTAAALDLYARAIEEQPDDPVVAFQYAVALRAVDRHDEAVRMVDRARALADRLGKEGAESLVALADRLRRPHPADQFRNYPPQRLDRDLLAGAGDEVDWRSVADAALLRQMYGLATYALGRWQGAPIDAEDARDLDAVVDASTLHESVLREFSAMLRTPPGDTTDAPRSTVTTLVLQVDVTPVEAPIGTATTVRYALRNASASAVLVNARMLVNGPGRPGELVTNVQGPSGYVELAGARINAGDVVDGDFVDLAPDESLDGTFALDRFHSLHLPGDYRVRVEYHNDVPQTPDGRTALVGPVVATATFRRTA
jgi:hypothetical protein